MRDKHYKTFGVRLSEDNIKWLLSQRQKHKSWNIFFNEIKEKYDKKNKEENTTKVSV